VRNSWREGGDTTQLNETILKTNENITEIAGPTNFGKFVKTVCPKNVLPLFGEKY
jgi:hypothetical protein